MSMNRRQHRTTSLGVTMIACLAASAFAGPVAAAPDPAKAEQRTEQKAEREAAKAERGAAREAAKAERAELRDARKAALEQRKVDARALREEARAAITELRDGFAAMSVEERKATLDEIRGVREGYQDLFLLLMESWRADRADLLPNTLLDGAEGIGAEGIGPEGIEADVQTATDDEPAEA